ncbi:hypothetical protein YC2023_008958 [Brassica napus]
MNSNSQTPVSGDVPATKPNGKDVVSSAEPVKRVGQAGVSLATAISGDSKSKKSNGKAVVSSADPVKRARQHGVSLPIAVSGVPNSKKLNGKAVVPYLCHLYHPRVCFLIWMFKQPENIWLGNIDEDVEEEPADEKDGAADGTVKRNSDGIESGETKRAKCG